MSIASWMDIRNEIIDIMVRRRFRLDKTPIDLYSVRVARTVEEYADAFALLHQAYVYQGIESVRAPALRITSQHLLPEATVIVAYELSIDRLFHRRIASPVST